MWGRSKRQAGSASPGESRLRSNANLSTQVAEVSRMLGTRVYVCWYLHESSDSRLDYSHSEYPDQTSKHISKNAGSNCTEDRGRESGSQRRCCLVTSPTSPTSPTSSLFSDNDKITLACRRCHEPHRGVFGLFSHELLIACCAGCHASRTRYTLELRYCPRAMRLKRLPHVVLPAAMRVVSR